MLRLSFLHGSNACVRISNPGIKKPDSDRKQSSIASADRESLNVDVHNVWLCSEPEIVIWLTNYIGDLVVVVV